MTGVERVRPELTENLRDESEWRERERHERMEKKKRKVYILIN